MDHNDREKTERRMHIPTLARVRLHVLRQPLFPVAAMLIAAATWWAYAPGLSGGFLFDDYFNLPNLGQYGRVDNFYSFILYLTSGTADPTGRPLSLLSFLLDAQNWPAAPGSFKVTNVLLHILNGLLLARVLLSLGRRLCLAELHARSAALLGAAIWLLHPFLVSTTLYIVQREAMLPATFTLVGWLLWDTGSRRLVDGIRGARWRMLCGAWGCTLLAVLSKGNGVLIPLLLLVIDGVLPLTTVQGQPAKKLRSARVLLLGLPSLLVMGWLLSKVPAVWSGQSFGRSWTVGERLLSEGRVLCDYLYALWIPRASAASLFNDDFAYSTSWLQPWTTLLAWVVIVGLLAAATFSRKRHPAIALAICFYLTGHLLESTVIQLELYFEHRNYLPALLMFWPLAIWLTAPGPSRRPRQLLTVAVVAVLAGLCHARAGIWGRPADQALLLAEVKPRSPRAQANAAAYEMNQGRPDLAATRLREAARKLPDEVQLTLNWVDAECKMGAVSTQALQAAEYSLAHNIGQIDLVRPWLIQSIREVQSVTHCDGLGLTDLSQLVGTMSSNINFTNKRGGYTDIHHLEGRIALAAGDYARALQRFNQSLDDFPIPDRALMQAALLGSAGYPELGLKHLDHFAHLKPVNRGLHGMARLHLWLLNKTGYWSGELAHMRRALQEDARRGAQHTGEELAP